MFPFVKSEHEKGSTDQRWALDVGMLSGSLSFFLLAYIFYCFVWNDQERGLQSKLLGSNLSLSTSQLCGLGHVTLSLCASVSSLKIHVILSTSQECFEDKLRLYFLITFLEWIWIESLLYLPFLVTLWGPGGESLWYCATGSLGTDGEGAVPVGSTSLGMKIALLGLLTFLGIFMSKKIQM